MRESVECRKQRSVRLDLARTLVAERPMALERENSKKWAKPVLVLGCLVGVG